VFENRMLRGIFGTKRDEIAGGRRKLHIEEHKLYFPSNIIRTMKFRRLDGQRMKHV
jgi:hypothetical protein